MLEASRSEYDRPALFIGEFFGSLPLNREIPVTSIGLNELLNFVTKPIWEPICVVSE
jgi:hypothetical protein